MDFALSREIWKEQYAGPRNSLVNAYTELYQKDEERGLNVSIPICMLYSQALLSIQAFRKRKKKPTKTKGLF